MMLSARTTARLSAGATATSPGFVGEVFGSNSSGSYIAVSDSPALRLGVMTIECLFNSSNNYGQLVGKLLGAGYDDPYALWLEGNDVVQGVVIGRAMRLSQGFSP